MENNFYYIFKRMIRERNYNNTYKMAWAKSLIELSLEREYENGVVKIKLEDIAQKYIKYYWNQTIFFNLIQGSNLLKTHIILQEVKELIKKYYNLIGHKKPDRFEKVEDVIKNKLAKNISCV